MPTAGMLLIFTLAKTFMTSKNAFAERITLTFVCNIPVLPTAGDE